jgi:dTMP kinase
MNPKGRFITFEGIDGAGKSTHINCVAGLLNKAGIRCIVTREPGGTQLGEMLRELLLREDMDVATEALLMFAARREHVVQKILPALESGTWVISDRFADASYAYQGSGKGLAWEKLEALESWTLGTFQPDLTLLFDLPAEIAEKRRAAVRAPDKFEQEKADFFLRVQAGYRKRATDYPRRFRLIDSSQSVEAIQAELAQIIQPMLESVLGIKADR